MKLKDFLAGRDALKALSEKNYTNYGVVRSLAHLAKAADEEIAFISAEETKLIREYAEMSGGSPVMLEGGRVKLKSAEAKTAFDAAMTELYETEITDIAPVRLHESDFRSAEDFPKPCEIISLEPLVIFED
ncbi:MAG: hypothetical protein LUC24_03095 [Bacteroidales bacterium]|nr:hypothetical protein [Bacteroidales bacterium]